MKKKHFDDDFVSRSQKKRDSSALQKIGEELCTLSPKQLSALPLNSCPYAEELKEAILTWHATKSHEGKRRQMQFIGKCMREIADLEPIKEALAALREHRSKQSKDFKHIEWLRDELLNTEAKDRPAFLQKELPKYASMHKECLHLAKQADNEQTNQRPPHAKRALFRLLNRLAEQEKE